MAGRMVFWRSTPPAIFPVCLGLLGLGLAWRRAPLVFPVPSAIGAILLLAGVLLLTFALVSYMAKVCARPAVVMADLHVTAARGALPAMSMALMLVAAAIFPHSRGVAEIVWISGIVMHLLIAALFLASLWRSPTERRMTNPYLFLTFVGLIVAPIAGIRLGYTTLSTGIFAATLPVYVVILAGSVKNILFEPVSPALRAAQVIHLAPVSLFGIVAGLLNYSAEFAVCVFLSGLLALILLLWSGWISEGGWRPAWGAMTFPVAAFTILQINAAAQDFGIISEILALAGLSFGSALILYITGKTIRSWLKGELAELSLAATA